MHDALARPGEGRASLLVPLIATLAGGLVTALAFPALAHVGYLVAGWADAAGELVGLRWGRRRYSVRLSFLGRSTRTLEGSLAVAAAAAVAATLGLLAAGIAPAGALRAAIVVGVASCVAEGLSGGYLDNGILQVAGAGVATALLGGL